MRTAILSAVFLALGAASAFADTLSGHWTGGYLSSDGQDVNTFEVNLTQAGATLSGTATEVNVFGDTNRALFLTSDLDGKVSGTQVTFTKTYDGSGGVAHSVTYTGRLDPNGRRIQGSYQAGDATGSFEMVR